MARLIRRGSNPPEGKLLVEHASDGSVEVFYVPPKEKLIQSKLDSEMAENYRVKILLISGRDDFFTIYPTNTLGGHANFLKPKYGRITGITLDGFEFENAENADDVMALLEELPSGFVKDYDFGLGLLNDYRFIIYAAEALSNCAEIVISKRAKTEVNTNSQIFTINYKDFDDVRRELNRITDRARAAARSVKDVIAFNRFAVLLDVEQRQLRSKNCVLCKMVSEVSGCVQEASDADQAQVLDLWSKNKKYISKRQPEKLAKLRNNIELVTLKLLIDKYEEMLGKKLNENRWQNLFNENLFILNMAFSYPIIKVRNQASVGGHKLSGAGNKVTDFLLKNGITNNTALVEIKTPQTNLLNKTAYRNGVYIPSGELSGSINQVLDQKYQFQRDISGLKDATRIYDIESYSVHCCLIIGKTPEGTDQQKSFEIFRRNSKDVKIITFDELLEKLKQIHNFLASSEEGGAINGSRNNLSLDGVE